MAATHFSRSQRSPFSLKTRSCWRAMKQRCDNPRNPSYHRYGGRGITYDPRWRSLETFVSDMGEAPPGLDLDRINNDGNYEKNNCRWVTHKANMNNRDACRRVTINGETKSIEEWATALNISQAGFYNRIRRGWPPEKMLKPKQSHRLQAAQPKE